MDAIFLDIETTGLDPIRHRAIDIALKIMSVNTGELKANYQRIVKQPLSVWENRDLASIEINGFTWDVVSEGTEPEKIRDEIISLFSEVGISRGQAVFICQNPAFDRGFFTHLVDVYTQERLNWPYHWLDLASMYWTVLIRSMAETGKHLPQSLNLSKNSIAKEYKIPPEEVPHKAMNGVDHLIQCYRAVLGIHDSKPLV